MIGLLVGFRFHPPAKLLLPGLSLGQPLQLIAEPDNPYDPLAVAVFLTTDDPFLETLSDETHAALDEALPSMGWTIQRLVEASPIQLGYLARQANKDLIKKQAQLELSAANRFIPFITQSAANASLLWGPNSEPLIKA
jgi:hypothetical protein